MVGDTAKRIYIVRFTRQLDHSHNVVESDDSALLLVNLKGCCVTSVKTCLAPLPIKNYPYGRTHSAQIALAVYNSTEKIVTIIH